MRAPRDLDRYDVPAQAIDDLERIVESLTINGARLPDLRIKFALSVSFWHPRWRNDKDAAGAIRKLQYVNRGMCRRLDDLLDDPERP